MNDIALALERLKAAEPVYDEGRKDLMEAERRVPEWRAEQAEAIRRLAHNVIRDMLEIGARLREVRNVLYHGEWEKWLDVEFGWSSRTARRYMAAAKAFGDKSDMVSALPIDIGALYLMARPRTPEAARVEAVERAGLGERITIAVAADIAAIASGEKPQVRPLSTSDGRCIGRQPKDIKPLIASCVEQNFARNGFNEPFSWGRDTPTDIAAIMVRSNRSKAERLMKALAKALAAEGSTCSSVCWCWRKLPP